jgi:hypothetical protein
LFGEAVRLLQRSARCAVDTLLSQLDETEEPSKERITAASQILGHALRYHDHDDVQAQVDALEAAIMDRLTEKDDVGENNATIVQRAE